MIVCYLDDSGKNPESSITSLAGYVASERGWANYESEVEKWFAEYGVRVLHAKELHDTDGNFKGWPVLKKQAFVSRICQARSPHLLLGVGIAAHKTNYRKRAAESNRKRTSTPYAFCMNVIVDWLLRDVRVGRAVNTEGLALVIESGHEENGDAERAFQAIREEHGLENVLLSISFVPKSSCRAVQLADLLAFYARREASELEDARRSGRSSRPMETMLRVIAENLIHRGFIATDFGPEAKGLALQILARSERLTALR
jgi:hypothetical protein